MLPSSLFRSSYDVRDHATFVELASLFCNTKTGSTIPVVVPNSSRGVDTNYQSDQGKQI